MRRLVLCTSLVLMLLFVASFAQYVCPYDPNKQDLSSALQAPSLMHPMGTDRYGRDMLSRVIIGSRTSIFSALALVATASIIGTAIGIECGFCGGAIDSLAMRLSDVCLAFPVLVFALFVAAVLKGGILNAILAIAAVSWPKYARLSRSMVLSLRGSDFVSAAKMSGLTNTQIAIHHALPNIIGPVAVTAALDIGTMMMELAGLSFLGLGAQPPVAEWGSMMSSGRSMLQTYPWLVVSPGIAIFMTVSAFNMLGDAVRDHFDLESRP